MQGLFWKERRLPRNCYRMLAFWCMEGGLSVNGGGGQQYRPGHVIILTMLGPSKKGPVIVAIRNPNHSKPLHNPGFHYLVHLILHHWGNFP